MAAAGLALSGSVLDQRRRKDGVLFALCAAIQTLSAFYYGFQVALAVGLYLLVRLVTVPNRNTVHRLAALLPWIALAALLIAPFAAPYLWVRIELGLERSIGETLQNWQRWPSICGHRLQTRSIGSCRGWHRPRAGCSPAWSSWRWQCWGSSLGLRNTDANSVDRREKSLRALVHVNPVCRGYWLRCSSPRIILSLGPRLKLSAADPGGLTLPFAWLYTHVPGMTAIRAPGRFANTAFLALAMLAAMGAAWLLGRIPPVVRRQTSNVTRHSLVFRLSSFVALAALILAEYAGGLGRFAVQPMPPTDGPLYAWLATQPPAALVELPLTSEMAGKPVGDGHREPAAAPWPDYNLLRYQYFQTGHWQPTVDGYSGFVPPHHRELGLAMAHFPDERSLALLRGLGVERVVVHADLLDAFQPSEPPRCARRWRGPRRVHERDFGSEWVYRLRPEPDRSGQVVGRFWSAADGQPFLILSSEDGRDEVIPPGQPLRVRGSWQPAGDGARSRSRSASGFP